jgi:hypothetical protein
MELTKSPKVYMKNTETGGKLKKLLNLPRVQDTPITGKKKKLKKKKWDLQELLLVLV